MAEALEGIVIADFSRVLAGPLATMVLADLGAEVVKVERPGTGDDTRGWGPPFDERGKATYFQAVNRNKRSVAIDLGDAAGAAAARELALRADVLVENFRPGVMDDFGLGYDELHRERPDLIYCSLTGFGSRGEGAAMPGYDLLLQAVGGLMSITGDPDGEPQKVGVALVDVISGLFAAVGVLAALRHRERTGEGQRVEIDLLSSLLAALVNQASAFTLAGVVAQRMGNSHPSVAPYEVLATGDGEIVVAVGNDRQFAALAAALEDDALARDQRFRTNSGRVAARAQLRAELERALATRGAADWVALLKRARVPAAQINDIGGAFALAERLGLEPVASIERPDGTAARLARNPIRLSVTPATYRAAPPELGEG
ncbi:MAG TPA: CoA transferase [Solirubrobacteraceae bacterium]|nr:CoA transferase [Solirubrobacteraceae bacterium]